MRRVPPRPPSRVGSSAKAWEPLRPFLEDYELIAIDLPGFGSAPPLPPGVETSIPAHADVVERELDAYGIEAADLVDNSSGAWLAL